ncbi:hypothetical protein [Sphaerospermopsis sp. FACHB-1094]|uniref:hypothetical protein n=1 Tax=Sphaerospermopsis sp. FACHB-1094 TaxID=2692861 RepID=UPI00321F970B
MTISIDRFSGTLEDLQVFNIQEIQNTFSASKIIEKLITTKANKPASQLVFMGKSGNDNLKNMQVVILQGDQAYTITYTAKVNDYDEFVETAEKMIKSLEID